MTSLLAEAGVPQGINELMAQRLKKVSADAGRLLAVAAVIGRDFDSLLLEALQRAPAGDVRTVAFAGDDAFF